MLNLRSTCKRLLLAAVATAGTLTVGIALLPSIAIAAEATTPPTTEPSPPDYSKYTQTVHLPFLKKTSYDTLGSMDVRVSINGGPSLVLESDTGSVGIIVGADQVPGFDPHGLPGSITYVSSGNELDGVWNTVTVTLVDAVSPDGKPVTARMPVLAAQKYQYHPGAVNARKATTTSKPAKPPTHPPHPNMFGIGFGRGSESHPERNPFLMLSSMQAGTMRRGYTISRNGFDLGLTPQNTGPNYLFEKLEPRPVSTETAKLQPTLHDWHASRGSVAVGDGAPIPLGILMDTGLSNFMIELPSITENKDVAPGTKITVGLLGDRIHYTFTAGDKTDPMTPRRVTWTHRDEDALLNPGIRSLASYDYLFDADGGYFALRVTRKHR